MTVTVEAPVAPVQPVVGEQVPAAPSAAEDDAEFVAALNPRECEVVDALHRLAVAIAPAPRRRS